MNIWYLCFQRERGYYRYISKVQLNQLTARFVPEHHLVTADTSLSWVTAWRIVARVCILSPFLGDSFLWIVDDSFECEEGLLCQVYGQFLFLSLRHWVISRQHQYFDSTEFEYRPDKAMAGWVEKGFDWSGVWFDERGPSG